MHNPSKSFIGSVVDVLQRTVVPAENVSNRTPGYVGGGHSFFL